MGSTVFCIELPVLGFMRAPELAMETAVLPPGHRLVMRFAVDSVEVLMGRVMLSIEVLMGSSMFVVEVLVDPSVFVRAVMRKREWRKPKEPRHW